MLVGVTRETAPGERRVALVPAHISLLTKAGLGVLVEAGAGAAAGFRDEEYTEKGAEVAPSREEVFGGAQLLLQVRTPGANRANGDADLPLFGSQHVVIGFADPLDAFDSAAALASRGTTCLAVELVPRITRAQSMDALSSMATVGGYKAVLLAASALSRMFPMLTTAAGTLMPARVLVIGAGVAGLQAIAVARRLGGRVEAYDVRPAVKEQIESLGAKFVELPLEATAAEDKSGYATAQDESFYRRQQELLARTVASSDAVISTAVVPGKRAPVLITRDMVSAMAAGSVIVDLAAERGGNCELTKADETVVVEGVTIFGPTNLAASVPYHASQMYSKNLVTFVQHLVRKGELLLDPEDEITRETLVTHNGAVVHPRIRALLGLSEAVEVKG
ncbi:MAG: NAD(P)(+) transhydrogenase (Re/Si-specific) subunit alpha [Luteitalea sp.]|nr:NAD(P)(+) transhydrogenase (Re/Si-specific) subunit alpha [Luteitalea sp.]